MVDNYFVQFISIHVTAKVTTRGPLEITDTWEISIHVTAKVTTIISWITGLYFCISIHVTAKVTTAKIPKYPHHFLYIISHLPTIYN